MRTRTVAVLVAVCILAASPLHSADRAITIGLVMDDLTPEEREPLRSYLTKAMGQPVTIEAPDTYRETVEHLADGSYDFACLGALMYIRAHAKYAVVPLVQRATDLRYETVFITPANSSINFLSDIAGKQIAFGDIDSTSGHLMAQYELQQAGIDPSSIKIRFSGSHPATAALVAGGMVDAGAIDKTVFDYLIRRGKLDSKKVRVFYTSKPYVDYVFVARKDVPASEKERFTRALLALKPGEDDSVLSILRAKHYVMANDEEYKRTRTIARELKMF